MNALELRAAAYLLAALGFIGLGAHLAGLHYRAVIASDNAAMAQAAAQSAMAAKAKEEAANANNARIVGGLQSQINGANASARDFANRLRDAEARSRVLSQATGKPGVDATGPQGGSDRLTGLLADAAAECLANEARQDALIQELKPQL